jgi:hypothetical protein
METARLVGLEVPEYTWDVAGRSSPLPYLRNGNTYRKVLGPPHVVTEGGLGVTTTNLLINSKRKRLPGNSSPWQFQEPVNFVAQWRFQVVGDRIWASRWKHAPSGREWDLRYCQEVLGEQPEFEAALPNRKTEKLLVKLVQSCGLTHAAPETLETADGRMVFIDLNPCGDWRGFYGRTRELEIAEELAHSITTTANRRVGR